MPLPVDPSNGKVIIIGYYPKIWLSVIGLVVFGLLTAAFFYRFFRFVKERYMLWITIGSLVMTAGFIVRIPMHSDPTSIPIYTVQTLLILLSPCAFIAQDYYVLPHMASCIQANDCLYIRPQNVKRIFIISDCITFVIQLAGSGMGASQNLAKTGEYIALTGLILQLISFALFIALLLKFGWSVRRRHPEKWSSSLSDRYNSTSWRDDWRTVYWATCWTTIGIMIRCVYRVIEFAQGYDGTLRTTEGYFYLLDSLPLVAAIVVWVIVWPPAILGREGRDAFLSPQSRGDLMMTSRSTDLK